MTKKNKGKVLILAPQPFYQNRGTPIAVKLLAEELAAGGYDTHLLVYHEGEDIEMAGVSLHRIPSLPFIKNIPPSISWKKIVCNVFMFFTMVKLIRKHDFDLLHAVEESAFMALLVKPFIRAPYLYDMDSSLAIQVVDKLPFLKIFRGVFALFEKRAVKGSCGVVAVCKALEDIARKYAPAYPVVRLEDITLLDSSISNGEILRASLPNSEPIILYIGNLEKYQGIDLLLKGFSLMKKDGCTGNLVIIGGLGKHINHYKHLAKKLHVDQHVFFLGPRPVKFLGHYLAQADILASPRTRGNNTPMKLYSYLDSGKPVVATNLSTHTQVLDSEFSVLVEPNSKSMAEGLKSLVTDRQKGAEIGRRGREIAHTHYSHKAYTKKLLTFYQEIFAKIKQ